MSGSARTSLWCNRFWVSIAVDSEGEALRLINLHLPMPSNSNVVVHVDSTPPCVVSQLLGFSSRRRHWGLPILGPRRCFPVQDLKQVEDRKNGPPSKRVPDCHQVAMPSEAPRLCFTIFAPSICVCLTPHEQEEITRAPLRICQSPDDWRVVPQWRPWCLVDVCNIVLIQKI